MGFKQRAQVLRALRRPEIELLEDRLAPANLLVTGAEAGGGPHVKAFLDNQSAYLSFYAYDPAFTGGVRVAAGDVTGDGVADIATAAGAGGGPHVKVFDGRDGALVSSFMAFDPSFPGGVNIALGDVNADGFADLVTGAGPGGGPHVLVFSGVDGSVLRSFFPYDLAFRGGVQVAVGDLDGDGFGDLITAAASSGGPHVQAFSGQSGAPMLSFFAYDPAFQGGVYVAAGNLDGDPRDEIVTGAGPGGGPHVRVFDARTGAVLRELLPFDPQFPGGVRVGTVDEDSDGIEELVTTPGPGGPSQVQVRDSQTLQLRDGFLAYHPAFLGGVSVSSLPEDLSRSASPSDPEAMVNRTSPDRLEADPDVAVTPSGDYVVAWRRMHETEEVEDQENPPGIKAQLYDRFGHARGGVIDVDRTAAHYDRPHVAVDAAGNFVVAFARSRREDDAIVVRRFDASGAAQGAAIVVASSPTSKLSMADVASDALGNFVVVWRDSGLDGGTSGSDNGNSGIAAQLFSAAGVAQGPAFRVNATVPGEQSAPSVSRAPDGEFVVAWHATNQVAPAGGDDVFARRFGAAGLPLGDEFLINSFTEGDQRYPNVALTTQDRFVVSWYGSGRDSVGDDVYARRYVGSEAQGPEVRVNTITRGDQSAPAVAVNSSGDYLVAWQGHGNGDSLGIFAQGFNSAGTPRGSTLLLNDHTQNLQASPSVGLDRSGIATVAWDSYNQFALGSDFDVFSRHLATTPQGLDSLAAGQPEAVLLDRKATPSRPPTPAGGVTFAIIGDFGWSTSETLGYDDHPVDYVGYLVRGWNPDFIISLGDADYIYGKNSWWDENVGKNYAPYINPYNALWSYGDDYPNDIPGAPPKAYNRWFGVPGNHDYGDVFMNFLGDVTRAYAYDEGFQPSLTSSRNVTPLAASYVSGNECGPNPNNGYYPSWGGYCGDGNEYYDYRMSPIDANGDPLPALANFYMIDGEQAAVGNASPSDRQATTILADATSRPNNAAWQFGMTHFEPFSTTDGGHLPGMDWNYQAAGVDALFAGHVHNYERLSDNASSFQYVVNGVGGFDSSSSLGASPFNGPVGTTHRTAEGATITSVSQILGFGATLVTLTPHQAVFQQWVGSPTEIASGNFSTVDSFTLNK